MSVSPAHAPARWSALTPGMAPRFERFRFMSADAGAAGTPGVVAAPGTTNPTPASVTIAPASTAPTPAAPAAPPAPATPDGLPDDPAALKAEIDRLRRENASSRTNAKTQAADAARAELTQQIAQALGLAPADTPPDPAQLTQQIAAKDTALAEKDTTIRDLSVELAVFRTTREHGGNPAALTDSRAFLAKVATLDPTAEDFTTKVTEAAKAAVTENPTLRTAPVAGASSVDHAGGPGETHSPAMQARPGQPRLAAAYASGA